MCIFKGQDDPFRAQETPEPPKLQDPEVKNAREREKRKARGSQGAKSNILTSPLGLTGEPATTSKPILGV